MIIRNLIHILQSENYDAGRFLNFAYHNLRWWRLQQRKKLVWTKKALLIYGFSLSGFFLFSLVAIVYVNKIFGLLVMIAFFVLMPFWLVTVLYLIKPIDFLLKNFLINQASQVLKNQPKLIKIAITGSFGKTTTKEILASILKTKYSVIKTQGNLNTDIGIANFILSQALELKKYQVLIVEMGAYQTGEIKKICDFFKPDYSVLTGINQTHLERFGSLKKIIQTKFELPQNTKQKSYLNFTDPLIKKHADRFLLKNAQVVNLEQVTDFKPLKKFQGFSFRYQDQTLKTQLLAKHNLALIMVCVKLARELKVDFKSIKQGLERLKPIKHRLEPIYNSNTDVMVIDDSYNANFNGIKSGLQVLNRAQKRKIVLTPGVVELGQQKALVHQKIARLYREKTDLVLVVKNSQTLHIIEDFKKNNFKNYRVYTTAKAAHADLANILKPGDTILFQNDLADNYF
ncbi:MAG: hypothetical protein GF332_00170 [Candidatus Moranbacteria bacterium]|nr:hypothetical protein [Candidatus Moranbacteria bacterium]